MGTIVCAVDDSPGAEEALHAAIRLSRDCALRLVIVHVEQGERAHGERRGSRLLERLATEHALNGTADRRVETGDRASELARVAAEEAASAIVVGSRSRHWWQTRVGGLAADLSSTATCPVVVVPPPARR
jgi:nucleotide-binding universal stress UspA family protein